MSAKNRGIAEPRSTGGSAARRAEFGHEGMRRVGIERLRTGNALDDESGTSRAHDRKHFLGLRLFPLRGQQAEIDNRLGVIRNDVEFRPAPDGADAEGGMTEHRVFEFFEIVRQSLLHREQAAGEFRDRILSALRAGTVRGASGRDNPRRHIHFVFVDDVEAGRFAHHDEIESLFCRQRLGTVLTRFLAHQSGEPDLVGKRRQNIAAFPQGPEHRGHGAFRVARPAAEDFSVTQIASERIDRHTRHAHRVGMRREKQPGLFFRGGKTRHDIGPSGRNFVQPRFRTECGQVIAQISCALLLPDPVRAGVPVGIDARNTDKNLRQFDHAGGSAAHDTVERNQSTNFGIPSEIFVFGT